MFFPIFFPSHHETTRCPKCQEEENKIEVCSHCQFVYPEGDDKPVAWLALAILIGGGFGVRFFSPSFAFYGESPGLMDFVMGFISGGALTFSVLALLAGIIWIIATLFEKKSLDV